MAANAVRKRCVDCKRTQTGDRTRMQWCDCGGEMRAIPYRPRRPKVKRAG